MRSSHFHAVLHAVLLCLNAHTLTTCRYVVTLGGGDDDDMAGNDGSHSEVDEDADDTDGGGQGRDETEYTRTVDQDEEMARRLLGM